MSHSRPRGRKKSFPCLQDVQRAFGDPIAPVHVMGAGILAAVANVFPNTPDFICHFHVLADVGKDLFGRENDCVVHTPAGKTAIQPQRTDNIMERFFRAFKRGWRRKTGNGSMGKTLKAMIADTPLVANLDNPQYVDILLAGKTTLQERFAEIDIQTITAGIETLPGSAGEDPSENQKNSSPCQDSPKKLTRIFGPSAQTA